MNEPVHVLWSGGWESTYRVLDLVFTEQAVVQPHYIVDINRPSSLHELRTMASIKHAIQ